MQYTTQTESSNLYSCTFEIKRRTLTVIRLLTSLPCHCSMRFSGILY